MLNILRVVVIIMALGLSAAAWGGDYVDPVTGMEFVLVKGGCYQMWEAGEESRDEGGVKFAWMIFISGNMR